jgi:[calcium/calmodulin-dependent protein kinase] kinase
MIDESDTLKRVGCTKLFMPPETFLGGECSGRSVDVWSTGVTFFYFAMGYYPYYAMNPQKLKLLIETTDAIYPENIDKDLKNLFERCLAKDPTERITIEEAMKHPWITNNGEEPLDQWEGDQIILTPEDLVKAISSVRIDTGIFVAAKIKGKFFRARANVNDKKLVKKSVMKGLMSSMTTKA